MDLFEQFITQLPFTRYSWIIAFTSTTTSCLFFYYCTTPSPATGAAHLVRLTCAARAILYAVFFCRFAAGCTLYPCLPLARTLPAAAAGATVAHLHLWQQCLQQRFHRLRSDSSSTRFDAV